ncbi:hypothetical protein WA1_14525 [Scytonema hofmannii PCC 7110]|uniref:Uncharacterized protein n=1 Tax=Scytonema hofmannii PCC 7110 TaxID=128403 RepID=A0A139XF30_9CYAN|nr:hypothetical protein WA1_14525 [Scytonema hofmannii PCC 7110]
MQFFPLNDCFTLKRLTHDALGHVSTLFFIRYIISLSGKAKKCINLATTNGYGFQAPPKGNFKKVRENP